MSEYYLADRLAAERAKQREGTDKQRPAKQTLKGTLLGEFLTTTPDQHGCDPYNSTQGKPERDLWKTRRSRF